MYKFVNLENGEEIMAYNTAIVYSNGINTPKTDQVIVTLKVAAMIFNMLPNSVERVNQGQGDIAKNALADGVKYRLDCLSGLTITVNDVRKEILGCCNDIGSLPKCIAYLGTEFETAKIPADIEELMDPRNEAYTDLWSLGMNDVVVGLTDIATQCWQWVEGVKDIIAELRLIVDNGYREQQRNPQQGGQPHLQEQPEPQQTIEIGKVKRGRGRPTESFKDKMIEDANGEKLVKIHKAMAGKKGKDAALIILASIDLGWLLKPTYTQVINEFGDIGSSTGYNRYLKATMFTKEEIEGAKKALS